MAQETYRSAIRETTCPPCAIRTVPESEWRDRAVDRTTPYYVAKAVDDARYAAANIGPAEITARMLSAMIGFHETVSIHEPDQTLGVAVTEAGGVQTQDVRRQNPRPMPPIAGCVALCLYKTATGECAHPIPVE